jgi:hypothetical protein
VIHLADVLRGSREEDNTELYARLRDLVNAIVVHSKPNTPAIQIDIKARLATLRENQDIFPNCSGSGDQW